MNPITEVILLAFARDWYILASLQYDGETRRQIKAMSDEIQKHIDNRMKEMNDE